MLARWCSVADIDAVVLGGGTNALGVVRALSRHGVRCAVVAHDDHGPARYSRHTVRHLCVPGSFDPATLVQSLGLQPRQAALFLTEEMDVFDTAEHPADWQAQFRTYFYRPDLALQLLSKSDCDRLAAEHGAPAPKTATVQTQADPAMLEQFKMPCVLKPVERNDAYSQRFKKAYRVETHAELTRLLTQILPLGIPMIVQEWIEGEDTDIYFNLLYIDGAGKLQRSFAGRKTLCWPPAVGGTAACMAAPDHHQALTAISKAFLERMGFRGLIGIEYKLDRRDGQFYLIEPTVYRTDYQHEVAALNGSDWLHAAYLDMLEQPIPPDRPYLQSQSWVDFPASRYSAQAAPPRDQPGRDCSPNDAHFRWSDPLPGLMHYARFLKTSLGSRLGMT